MNARKIVDILLEEEEEDFDAYFLAAITPWEAINFVLKNPELGPKLEPVLARSGLHSFNYANKILHGPFPAGEPEIAKDGITAGRYALHVIKKPFPLGEPAIAKAGEYRELYNQRFGTNI